MPSDRSLSFNERVVMMWECPDCGKFVGEGVVKGAYARHEDQRDDARPRCQRSFTKLIGDGTPGYWGNGPRKSQTQHVPGQQPLFDAAGRPTTEVAQTGESDDTPTGALAAVTDVTGTAHAA